MARVAQRNPTAGAEELIIEAARRLFTTKGFAAVKTRDIAKEAGINLALLNYYFRSKEKLFEIIMTENLSHFFQGVSLIVNDRHTSLHRKIDMLVEFYITRLMKNPDVPLFVLNQARNNPNRLPKEVGMLGTSYLLEQCASEAKAGKIKKINPAHLMLNILGLSIFPFVARHMAEKIRNIGEKEFYELMEERKKLVPIWINAMLELRK